MNRLERRRARTAKIKKRQAVRNSVSEEWEPKIRVLQEQRERIAAQVVALQAEDRDLANQIHELLQERDADLDKRMKEARAVN